MGFTLSTHIFSNYSLSPNVERGVEEKIEKKKIETAKEDGWYHVGRGEPDGESEDWDKEGKKKGTVERRHEEDGDDTAIQHRKCLLLSGLGFQRSAPPLSQVSYLQPVKDPTVTKARWGFYPKGGVLGTPDSSAAAANSPRKVQLEG